MDILEIDLTNVTRYQQLEKSVTKIDLNGYAHFSSLFLCAINVAIWGKLKSKRFEI